MFFCEAIVAKDYLLTILIIVMVGANSDVAHCATKKLDFGLYYTDTLHNIIILCVC